MRVKASTTATLGRRIMIMLILKMIDDLHSCLDEKEDGALKTMMIMIMAKDTYPRLKK